MKKWLKCSLIGACCVAVLAAALPAGGAYLASRKVHRRIAVQVAPLALPTDAKSLERGRYLFASRGCAECHGKNGAGRVFASDGNALSLKSPNITRGEGGVVRGYRDEDWVRTIRHGVKPDGQPVFIMPSEDYARLTDADVAAVAAYARQLPAAAGEGAVFELPLVLKTLYALGVIKDAAEKIDHTLAPAQPVPEEVSVQHGQYVANMCMGCHGATLTGGKLPGHPPHWPPAANLTPGRGSVLPRYPNADAFIAMLRSGKRPDGSSIDRAMPFETLGALSDVDAKALYLYLKGLPPSP
jgi:mono/diheme cytochrome c family protein